MVQLFYLYMTTGKTKALTMWTLVGKGISLFFVTCCTSLHSFPSKEQAPFNFMAAVTVCSDFGAHTQKYLTVSTSISLSIYHLIPIRWQSRRMHIYLLCQEQQYFNGLLKKHRQNIGSHQKKIPHVQGQRRT